MSDYVMSDFLTHTKQLRCDYSRYTLECQQLGILPMAYVDWLQRVVIVQLRARVKAAEQRMRAADIPFEDIPF